MILKELLEVLNANVYFHLFKEKHIGRFDKYDIGISTYLLDYVKEINIEDEVLEITFDDLIKADLVEKVE